MPKQKDAMKLPETLVAQQVPAAVAAPRNIPRASNKSKNDNFKSNCQKKLKANYNRPIQPQLHTPNVTAMKPRRIPLARTVKPNYLFIYYAAVAGSYGALSGTFGKLMVSDAPSTPHLNTSDTSSNAAASIPSTHQHVHSGYEGYAATFLDSFLRPIRLAVMEWEWIGAVSYMLNPHGWILQAVARVCLFALNGAATGQMWRYYLKSLSVTPSTALAQMVNTGTNFLVSVVCGIVVFREDVESLKDPLWLTGVALVIIGMALIP